MFLKIVVALTLFANLTVSADGAPMDITEFFNKARYENMEELCREFYDENVEFADPIGTVSGIEEMIRYYKHMYKNVIDIKFVPINEFQKENEKVFVWKMFLKHKRIKSGEEIAVDGMSIFRYENDKVIYHRDYFDAATMIYENIPILGSIIGYIKSKAHGAPDHD